MWPPVEPELKDGLWSDADSEVDQAPRRDNRNETYRHAAYVTGLAVTRESRRKGVASALLDYAERKGEAWGASGLCLHVNRLNTPALYFYESRGYGIIPDWYGYNSQRFLLHRPLGGASPEIFRDVGSEAMDKDDEFELDNEDAAWESDDDDFAINTKTVDDDGFSDDKLAEGANNILAINEPQRSQPRTVSLRRVIVQRFAKMRSSSASSSMG
jgi:hypothetical protein